MRVLNLRGMRIPLFPILVCLGIAATAFGQAVKYDRFGMPIKTKPKKKVKGAADLLKGIRFSQRELEFQSMVDEEVKQRHERKIKRAGLKGRDPVEDLPSFLALASLEPTIEERWGDGFIPKAGDKASLMFHIAGQPVKDRTELFRLTNALQVVYGGLEAASKVCVSANGTKLGQALVDRSSLVRIKTALGLMPADMEPYRVLKGVANAQPIELREGIDLDSRTFRMLINLVEQKKPITVRIEGGLKASSSTKLKKVRKKLEQAVADLEAGPDEGLIIWNQQKKGWAFRARGKPQKALDELRKLLKETNEFDLKNARIEIEYPVFETSPKTSQYRQWRVGLLASDADGALMADFQKEWDVNYQYVVEQERGNCSIHVKLKLEPARVIVEDVHVKAYRELKKLELINFETHDLLIGYLKKPNCSAKISTGNAPELSPEDFDKNLRILNR